MFFKKNKKDNLWIIAGLGNPGRKYDGTRHNIGFCAVDAMAETFNCGSWKSNFHSLTVETELNGVPLLLMKPQTLMNLSGTAISEAAHFYKVPSDRIIVFCDDINLDAGSIRIREKGSAGGHNGLKDIIAKVGSDSFYRIRIGAGKMPSSNSFMPDWVLSQPSAEDKKKISSRYPDAVDATKLIIEGKLLEAQSRFNH